MSKSSAPMIYLTAPGDEKLLASIGRIAIFHGHLDHILRMTVKSLAGVSIREALDATARQGSGELRKRVRQLARKRLGEGAVLVKIDAILERSRQATEKRNELLHGLWAQELDGGAVVRTEDHQFIAPPTVDELDALADELASIGKELNIARLDGFLKVALGRQ